MKMKIKDKKILKYVSILADAEVSAVVEDENGNIFKVEARRFLNGEIYFVVIRNWISIVAAVGEDGALIIRDETDSQKIIDIIEDLALRESLRE